MMMRGKAKAFIGMILCAFMLFGTASVFTGCSKRGGANDFTWFITKHDGAGTYYDKYEQSMVAQWINNQKWDAETGGRSLDGSSGDKLNFSFTAPIAGTEAETLNRMIVSGEYADVINLQYSTSSDKQLIEDGVLMELTEYVEQYMPNYISFLNANPSIKSLVTEKDANGKYHYYSIYSVFNSQNWPFQGFSYRRDWLVKNAKPTTHIWDRASGYGINKYPTYPVLADAKANSNLTGWIANDSALIAADKFTSSYGSDPNETYTDNVIFPSGTSDPLYISDWEWMFPYLKSEVKASDSDSYVISIGYGGYAGTGEIVSSFGGGSATWYYKDDGTGNYNTAAFGGTSDNFKAYLDCVNNWNKNGWLDKKFEQRSGDMFYKINTSGFTQGKVGMWQGNIAYLGDVMKPTTGDDKTMVFGCPQPINDVYGGSAQKFVTPDVFYQQGPISGNAGVSVAAKNKNLPALFAYFNWMFSEEGGVTVGVGLNEEQYNSMSFNHDLFAQRGITTAYDRIDYVEGDDDTTTVNGVTTDANGCTFKYQRPVDKNGINIADDVDFSNALTGFRFTGFLNYVKEEKKVYKKVVMEAVENWMVYTAKGQTVDYTGLMQSAESNTFATIDGKVKTYLETNLPSLIKKSSGISSSDWSTFCSGLNKREPEKVTTIYQAIKDRI